MPRKTLWIAASCILALVGLLPVFSTGASPASKEKVIYAFTGGADGRAPSSDLTFDIAGNLYGTTQYGGTGTLCNVGCGTVFELKRSQSGWTEQVLYSFTGGNDGAGPQAGVIFDNSGNLYGTTFAKPSWADDKEKDEDRLKNASTVLTEILNIPDDIPQDPSVASLRSLPEFELLISALQAKYPDHLRLL